MPNNPSLEATNYFKNENNYNYMLGYEGTFKEADKNYETDYNQMKILGVHNINKGYWLASRRINASLESTRFYVSIVNASAKVAGSNLVAVISDGTKVYNSRSYGLRPVFTLKSDSVIIGGEGTVSSPYTLGK